MSDFMFPDKLVTYCLPTDEPWGSVPLLTAIPHITGCLANVHLSPRPQVALWTGTGP